ncbi:hypothetical protein BKA70DRAFT_1505956 [Coprinopsis sp. MPI-PUGE-AT-0042]|nr:hypothetical protein BKA70DRAFT_1505956 [Coprinopsis sp. MPI-PUGE-AT-0042]
MTQLNGRLAICSKQVCGGREDEGDERACLTSAANAVDEYLQELQDLSAELELQQIEEPGLVDIHTLITQLAMAEEEQLQYSAWPSLNWRLAVRGSDGIGILHERGLANNRTFGAGSGIWRAGGCTYPVKPEVHNGYIFHGRDEALVLLGGVKYLSPAFVWNLGLGTHLRPHCGQTTHPMELYDRLELCNESRLESAFDQRPLGHGNIHPARTTQGSRNSVTLEQF